MQILIPSIGFVDTAGASGLELLIPEGGFFDVFSEEPTAPEKATTPDPADDGTGVAAAPTLTWSNGGGATSYDVYFGTESGALDSIGNQAGTSYEPGTLDPETEYFWRIDAVNAYGTTTGDEWSFTTGTAVAIRKATTVIVIT